MERDERLLGRSGRTDHRAPMHGDAVREHPVADDEAPDEPRQRRRESSSFSVRD
jgi:hypothetical protein